jgi:hypothetical protein
MSMSISMRIGESGGAQARTMNKNKLVRHLARAVKKGLGTDSQRSRVTACLRDLSAFLGGFQRTDAPPMDPDAFACLCRICDALRAQPEGVIIPEPLAHLFFMCATAFDYRGTPAKHARELGALFGWISDRASRTCCVIGWGGAEGGAQGGGGGGGDSTCLGEEAGLNMQSLLVDKTCPRGGQDGSLGDGCYYHGFVAALLHDRQLWEGEPSDLYRLVVERWPGGGSGGSVSGCPRMSAGLVRKLGELLGAARGMLEAGSISEANVARYVRIVTHGILPRDSVLPLEAILAKKKTGASNARNASANGSNASADDEADAEADAGTCMPGTSMRDACFFLMDKLVEIAVALLDRATDALERSRKPSDVDLLVCCAQSVMRRVISLELDSEVVGLVDSEGIPRSSASAGNLAGVRASSAELGASLVRHVAARMRRQVLEPTRNWCGDSNGLAARDRSLSMFWTGTLGAMLVVRGHKSSLQAVQAVQVSARDIVRMLDASLYVIRRKVDGAAEPDIDCVEMLAHWITTFSDCVTWCITAPPEVDRPCMVERLLPRCVALMSEVGFDESIENVSAEGCGPRSSSPGPYAVHRLKLWAALVSEEDVCRSSREDAKSNRQSWCCNANCACPGIPLNSSSAAAAAAAAASAAASAVITTSSTADATARAGITGSKIKACSGCQMARFCSEACHRRAWIEGGHKSVCKALSCGGGVASSTSTTSTQIINKTWQRCANMLAIELGCMRP